MKARILLLSLGLMTLLTGARCGEENERANDAQFQSQSGLKIEDVKIGTGPEAKAGNVVRVHYTGTLTNGQKFDSSKDRNQPFEFPLGGGRVIQGWDQGVAGMKVGGIRKLTIPPEMGYGSRDMGVIPPNSVLLFEVELLAIVR